MIDVGGGYFLILNDGLEELVIIGQEIPTPDYIEFNYLKGISVSI